MPGKLFAKALEKANQQVTAKRMEMMESMMQMMRDRLSASAAKQGSYHHEPEPGNA